MDRQAQRDIRRKLNCLQFAQDCGSVVRDGTAEQVMDGSLIFFTAGRRTKPGNFGIAHQQALALQVAGNTPRVLGVIGVDADSVQVDRHQTVPYQKLRCV